MTTVSWCGGEGDVCTKETPQKKHEERLVETWVCLMLVVSTVSARLKCKVPSMSDNPTHTNTHVGELWSRNLSVTPVLRLLVSCLFSHEPHVRVPVTLLHNGDFLDDLLKIGLHRNLFNGDNLPGLFIMGFEHTAIRPAETQRTDLTCWVSYLLSYLSLWPINH